MSLAALPLIFQQFHESGKTPREGVARELLEVVKIYNPIPIGAESDYAQTLLREYTTYLEQERVVT